MSIDLFSFTEYKPYLAAIIKQENANERGARTRLAKSAGCQLAFFSLVMNGAANLSLEQADGISHFLGHTAEEREYLLLLVQCARASTKSLRDFLDGQMQKQRKRRAVLSERIDAESRKGLSEKDKGLYYGSWHYGAVHLAAALPSARGRGRRDSIARLLRLKPTRVAEILKFLEITHLIRRKEDGYVLGKERLHLDSGSPFILQHHQNLRQFAIQAADPGNGDALQYSSFVTVSEADAKRVRRILADEILRIKGIVRGSTEERLYCFNVDFFGLE